MLLDKALATLPSEISQQREDLVLLLLQGKYPEAEEISETLWLNEES